MNALQAWLIVLALAMTTLSLITLCIYAYDKRQAGRSGWRVSEKQLHLFALLGGWPGALIGRRWLRHKSIKTRFRIVFWLTVIGHVALASGVTYVVWHAQR